MLDAPNKISEAWNALAQRYQLSSAQIEQFKTYLEMLKEWNERFNITAHSDSLDIIMHHFYDSLSCIDHIDGTKKMVVADVGTGGGFPALPLKIVRPNVGLILIEVNAKKREFLAAVVDALGLDNVIISELDWRTFLRQTSYDVDYVIARASLQPSELLRMFKPSSHYKDATLIYWASSQWQPESQEKSHITHEVSYEVDDKTRRLIFFK